MDLSYWTNSNLKHNYKQTNKLFYGEYKYCASGELDYAKLLRGFDRDVLEHRIRTQKSLEKSAGMFGTYFGYQYSYGRRKFDNDVYENLHNFLTILQTINDQCKIVLSWHNFYVYTDHVNIVKDVLLANGVFEPLVTEINISHPPNTIVKKSSEYQYRCYLKNSVITSDMQDSVRKFFSVYGDSVSVSKTFNEWLTKEYKYCRDYFFFDFNDPGLEIIFEMIAPGLIKEKLEIITQD